MKQVTVHGELIIHLILHEEAITLVINVFDVKHYYQHEIRVLFGWHVY